MSRSWFLLVLVVLLTACGEEPDSPETRLRSVIEQAERAIEARELSKAAGFISTDYTDGQGRDARAVRQLLLGYLYRNRNIHLLTRVADLQLSEDGRSAEVRLYAAMAGVPIVSYEAMVGLQADLHRFDLSFADTAEGWRLTGAAWQRASLEDWLE